MKRWIRYATRGSWSALAFEADDGTYYAEVIYGSTLRVHREVASYEAAKTEALADLAALAKLVTVERSEPL